MRGNRIVIGLGLDAPAIVRPVIPVEQHRGEAGDEPVGNLARRPGVVVLRFRQDRSQRRAAAAQDVHRMRRGRQVLQHRPQHHRQATQRLEFLAVLIELRQRRQSPVKQQVGHFFESGMLGQRNDVVAAVVQVVAARARPNRSPYRRPPRRTGDGFLALLAAEMTS
jgi:hypothetical protein